MKYKFAGQTFYTLKELREALDDPARLSDEAIVREVTRILETRQVKDDLLDWLDGIGEWKMCEVLEKETRTPIPIVGCLLGEDSRRLNRIVSFLMPLYKVIDLTSGVVEELDAVPPGGWTDEHKTRKLVLRRIDPGSFTMGSSEDEEGRSDDEIQHRVTLTKPYYIGVFEVTQDQWKRVMGGTVEDQVRKALHDDAEYLLDGEWRTWRDLWRCGRDDDPSNLCGDVKDTVAMYYVNWIQSAQFCARIGRFLEKECGPSWGPCRLPTEAEWEYACRAGTTSALPNGSEMRILGINNAPVLNSIAWYGGNSSVGFIGRGFDTSDWEEKQAVGGFACAREVGEREPNRWGLYDMIGNVWEWCSDWYATYDGDATNPSGPASGEYRVLRGGSWVNNASACRSATRFCIGPGSTFYSLGFRICCSAEPAA